MQLIYLYVKESPLGLKYLGQTVQNPYRYKGSGKVWKNHIKFHKFTYEDIKTTILLETYNREDIKLWGMYYSNLWDVVKDKNWANLICETGEGGILGCNIEVIQKISNSLKGRKIPEKQRIKNTIAVRKARGKSIIQLDLNNNFIKEWECINDASKELNITCTNIVAQLKNKTKCCREFVFVYKNEYNINTNYSVIKGKERNNVAKYSLDMELIFVYNNSYLAALSVNGNFNNINAVCIYYSNEENEKENKRINKSYKGYIWKYKKD